MASTINASTTLGLISTADTSGVLQLQTANTTAVTVNANQTVSLAVGTANGVTYLNGSKVLTSGSALTFDGTTLTGTASGAIAATFNRTTSSGATVKVQVVGNDVGTLGSDTGGQGRLDIASVAAMQLRATGASSYISFDANNAEGMRLTSTGLGIGTSSPDSKLVIAGYTGGSYNTAFNNGGQNNFIVQGTSGYTMFRKADSTELMRLDSAGNLGLGVTPSAWNSIYKVIQTDVGSMHSSSTYNNVAVGTNFFYNASNSPRYIRSDFATQHYQYQGQHQFFTAPSGTAGNAITFTQAMTLDANGNLGIGTSSPAQKLDMSGASARFSNGSYIGYLGAGSLLVSSATATDFTLRSDNVLSFATGGPYERARIDSSGNLLVGTTTLPSPANQPTKGLVISNNGNNGSWTGTFQGTGASANRGVVAFYPNSSPNDVNNQAFYFIDSTTNRFEVRSNGGIANYSANNVNLSDRREKTNFAPAGLYLDKICAIPVQTFNYIDQNMVDDGGLTLGVVAQDVQAVAPEMVMESNWGTENKPKMRLSIYQTDLQYALMKCIQEMKTIIDDQAARIATLEAK